MVADPVRRRRGKRRPTRRDPDEVELDLSPDEEFFRDDGEISGDDLRRLQIETASGVYARRRAF